MRRNRRHTAGRFVLYSSENRHFLSAMGLIENDRRESEHYLYWTRYQEWAQGFQTVKQARAMRRLLFEKSGELTVILDRRGRALE